ncbi:hypothetical protein SAMN04487824_1324 [Parafannyhessea umbonata]|uniref:Uncharacterized protein n=2 Tax=Parafannyhessea umbonata TaxID=604330 RepID=A0A1G6NBV4_9ACTN|nr:hypothetical protein SAMN04487824_1324 [Parafannyhessea umbonata]
MLRGLHVGLGKSLCAAPILTLSLIAILGELYAVAGIYCTPMMLLAPIYVVALVFFLVRRGYQSDEEDGSGKLPIPCIALFFVVGVGVGWWVFLRSIQIPSATIGQTDAIHHYNAIRSILDTGRYTSIKANAYATFAGTASAFYPSLWHECCALSVSLFDIYVATSANLVNFMFAFEVFPLAMLLLLSEVFRNNKKILPFAACAVLAFQSYPWGMLYWGPIWPNLAGFATMPIGAWLFMKAVEAFRSGKQPLLFTLAFLLSCASLFLLHSNALFTCVYFLVPWCVHEIWSGGTRGIGSQDISRQGKHLRRSGSEGHGIGRAAASVLFILFVILILVALYNLPLLKGIVTFYWGLEVDPATELVNILTLDYVGDFYPTTMQLILAVFVAAGYILALRNRDLRWTAVSYTIAVMVCFGDAVLPAPWKNYFAGFWYTDPFRVASMASIFAMPLVAYALASLFGCLRKKLFHQDKMSQPSMASKACALLFIMAFIALNHVSSFMLPAIGEVDTPFGKYRETCRRLYDLENQSLTASERVFIDKAKETVGDSVVLSYPGNGTAAAYGLDGINTLYREAGGATYDETNENDTLAYDQMVIASGADEVATDATVRAAMQDVGAKYVLILSMSDADYEYERFSPESTYAGLLAVNEETPGYRLVMEEGGMKLLEITAVEE